MNHNGFGASNPTERHVRRLRDRCYVRPVTDDEWSRCRDNWMRPDSVKWLEAHQTALPDREARP